MKFDSFFLKFSQLLYPLMIIKYEDPTKNGITTKEERARKGLRYSIIPITKIKKIKLGIKDDVRLFVISFILSQSLMILVIILPDGLESKNPNGRERILEYASVLAL